MANQKASLLATRHLSLVTEVDGCSSLVTCHSSLILCAAFVAF